MDRLTEWSAFGGAYIIGVDSEDLQYGLPYDQLDLVADALDRLAAYEDTGLTPDEVAETAEAMEINTVPERDAATGGIRMLTLCRNCAALIKEAYDMHPDSVFAPRGRCDHCGRTSYGLGRYVVCPRDRSWKYGG